jgi:DNA-3-methyladenine glycosylase
MQPMDILIQRHAYPSPPVVSRAFFARDTKTVAQESLGKLLVRVTEDGLFLAKIVETEAYLGEHDPAAHASFGRTKRTAVLYGEPGHAYVFQLRGHHCLNFVAEPSGSPGCVLIRAVEPLSGIETMRQLRGKRELKVTDLANGPGKLCQAMSITMTLYGSDLVHPHSPLQVWEPFEENEHEIEVSHRIGITKAADWDLRFTLKRNAYLSRYHETHALSPSSTRHRGSLLRHIPWRVQSSFLMLSTPFPGMLLYGT